VHYDLWDTETGNLLACYPTESVVMPARLAQRGICGCGAAYFAACPVKSLIAQ
jgi:hypothetical protein